MMVGQVNPADLEQLAIETYERARLDPAEPVRTVRLARLVLGDPGAVVRAPLTLSGPAVKFIHNGRVRIGVRRNLPAEYALFFIGHELAHVVLEREGVEDDEASCDYLGACFIAPRPAVHRLHRAFGFDLTEIAARVRSTQTWAALRVGESESIPIAALSRVTVRVRGPESWVWPDERELRRAARADEPGPGLRKVAITDGRGRMALVAGDE
jgi:hypothetical protein